jgi:hypothetical protein
MVFGVPLAHGVGEHRLDIEEDPDAVDPLLPKCAHEPADGWDIPHDMAVMGPNKQRHFPRFQQPEDFGQ